MTAPQVRVVGEWQDALNAGDVDRLVALSHPDIELGGPKGTGRGSQLLREWVARAGIRLEPRRVFHRGDTVVVEQAARWLSTDTGEEAESRIVGSVFVVQGGGVASVARYGDLAEALRAADMDESDEADAEGRSSP